MNFWQTVEPIWKVLAVGLLLGAGLPALFALGMRFISGVGESTGADGTATKASALGMAMAGLCFLVVAAAVLLGLAVIVDAKDILPAIGLGSAR